MRYSQRFLGSTQRCFAVHLYLLGLKGKTYLLYSSSLCSSSRFVDVLIPLDLLRSSAACGEYSVTQYSRCRWRERASDTFRSSRTRQQFEGIGIFDSTAQGRDSSNQHFRGKTNLCWTYLRWTLQGHKEHGMARCNLWLHPIRPIGISGTHIPPSAGVAEYQCRVARASAPKVEGNRPRSSKMRNDHENKGCRGASPSNWQDGPHVQTHRVICQWMWRRMAFLLFGVTSTQTRARQKPRNSPTGRYFRYFAGIPSWQVEWNRPTTAERALSTSATWDDAMQKFGRKPSA